MTHFANKKVLAIAWPMMLTSMSVPLLGLVDTALLGHLDSARYLAAVAIGANVIGLLYWSFGFLRMGTTSLVAQGLGRFAAANTQTGVGQPQQIDGIIFRAIVIAVALGFAITVITPPLADWIVTIMNAGAQVDTLAAEYIRIRLISAPAALVTYVISGWLVGVQQPKSALALVLTCNLINIVLDIVFIVGLGMTSAGAALATVIAEYCALVLGLIMLLRLSGVLQFSRWRGWMVANEFWRVMNMNYHLLLRTLLLLFALNFFTAQGAVFGENTLAANAILLQLAMFSAYVMDGFSYAAEALCGQNSGRGRARIFHYYAQICGRWIALTAVVFAALYWLGGGTIVGWFSDVDAITDISDEYLYWLAIMPIAGGLAYLLDGVFIGAGNTRAMHLSMWFSVLGVFLPLWWLTQGWGNHGLWFAFIAFNLARGLSLLIRYRPLLQRVRANRFRDQSI